MTVPRLTGWFDEIAPSLERLSYTIPRLLNPNLDIQRSVREAIAKNPGMLQQYADINARTPGVFDRMGLPDVTKLIQQMPESAKAKLDRMESGILDQPLSEDEKIETRARVTGTLTPRERRTADLDIRGKELGIDINEANKIIAEAMARVANIKSDADAVVAKDKLQEAQDYITGLSAIQRSGGKAYEAFKSGKLSPEEATIITRHPKLRELFDTQRDDFWRVESQRLQRELAAAYRSSDEDRIQLAIMQTNLRRADEIADYAGSSAENVLAFWRTDPAYQEKLRNASQPPNPNDPNEVQLWRIARAQRDLGTARIQKTIMPIVSRFLTATSKERAIIMGNQRGNPNTATEMINNAAMTLFGSLGEGSVNANPPKFRYDSNFWKRERKLILESGDLTIAESMGIPFATAGKVNEQNAMNNALSDPTTRETFVSTLIEQLSLLRTEKEKSEYLDNALRDVDPQTAAGIRNRVLLRKR